MQLHRDYKITNHSLVPSIPTILSLPVYNCIPACVCLVFALFFGTEAPQSPTHGDWQSLLWGGWVLSDSCTTSWGGHTNTFLVCPLNHYTGWYWHGTKYCMTLHCVYDIPGQREIRPVMSRGKGQCLSEAEEVLRTMLRLFCSEPTKQRDAPCAHSRKYDPLSPANAAIWLVRID